MNRTEQVIQMSPLTVAYVGDAVFTLFIRNRLAVSGDHKSGMLHKLTSGYVSAVGQSKIFEKLSGVLTGEENDMARRARNAHTNNKAKNAGLAEYKRATALEGVIGFLYLTENKTRLEEILDLCAGIIETGGLPDGINPEEEADE